MWAEFKHTLRRMRGQIIGWSIGVGLYGLTMALFYPSVTQMAGLEEMLSSYPKEMLAFFENIQSFTTPAGYMDTYYFAYMHLIIGILTISAGASLVVGDEENGILDLLLAQPVSRSALFWGRLLGLAVATVIILLTGYLCWTIPAPSVGLDLTWLQLLWPVFPLLAVLLLFGTLALLLSMVLPAARIAGMVTGALMVGNFLLMGLSNINDDLEPVMKLTPLAYYQGGMAVDGLNWGWLAGLLTAALLFAVAAWLLFRRRDIRVGGERSWKMPKLMPRRARS
jgi:ABC-2 type transport system permease protein